MLVRLLLFFCLCLSAVVFAEEQASEVQSSLAEKNEQATAAPQPSSSSQLPPAENNVVAVKPGAAISTTNPFWVLLGLAFVVALIFIIAWMMKRLGAGHFGGSGIKIVAGVSVGPREKVLLLDVGGQQTLIGVAPGRVSHLQSFESQVLQPTTVHHSDFSRKLKSMMQAQLKSDRSEG